MAGWNGGYSELNSSQAGGTLVSGAQGAGARTSPPPPPPDLPLDIRYDILGLQDFRPGGARSGSPRDLPIRQVVALTSPGSRVHQSSLIPPLHLSQEKPP